MSVIEDVKQKTDIVDVIGQQVSLKKAGRNLSGLCPFHAEKNPSFFVYPEQQSWHCFGCNRGGDVLSFVMRRDSLDFGEALRLLADRAGVIIPSRPEQDKGKEERDRLRQLNEAAAQYFHDLLVTSPAAEKARTYLNNRRFSADTINDFRLGYCLNSWESLKQHLLERGYTESELPTSGLLVETEDGKSHDRFRNKVIFPIQDIRGHVTGFGARVLDDSLPKYVNSPQTPLFDKSGSLYGINLAAPAIRQQATAVIVEGYVDVITAHQNGFNNVVASMGTSVTERQISALKKLTRNVVLALDADAAGKEAMLRGVSYENILEAEVKVATLPAGKDPDDVIKDNPENWRELLATAQPIMDYTFGMVTAELDLATARGKSLAAERLLPILAEIKDGVRRTHYLQKLARMIDVTLATLEAELSRVKPRPESRRRPVQPPKAAAPTARSILTSRLEEDCLALLLQHPELKENGADLVLEYFENSENREIFIAWQRDSDLQSLKKDLDTAIHEHFEAIAQRNLASNQVAQRYADYTRRLKEIYLKRLEAKRSEQLAFEVESKGTGADLAKLKEEGVETAVQLRIIHQQKRQRQP
ncbi:MAG: DNA primase [Chloroflexi bacterium]|nr:DNA primase [Chloroflexota bacterium]